jgi:hypothetical protein
MDLSNLFHHSMLAHLSTDYSLLNCAGMLLHVLLVLPTDRPDMKALAATPNTLYSTPDADPSKDHTTIRPTLDISATATSSSDLSSFSGSINGLGGTPGVAAPTSLCPVVAFTSWAAQLSFKALMHLAVFGGEWLRRMRGTPMSHLG